MTLAQAEPWIPLLMPAIMLLNLVVSAAIAVLVYRFTRRQARMEALTLVHSRWHEINKLIIGQPGLQRLLEDERFAGKSDAEIVAYNFLFQIVNTSYEIHFAATQGLIAPALARQFIAGNASILRHRRDDVLELLAWNRGYDVAFCEVLRGLLATADTQAVPDAA